MNSFPIFNVIQFYTQGITLSGLNDLMNINFWNSSKELFQGSGNGIS